MYACKKDINERQWTIHTPKECKRLPSGKGKSKLTDKKAIKRAQFKERKKAYIHAKAAYEALMNTSTDSDEETSNSDNDEGSNKSVSSYSSEDSNISWRTPPLTRNRRRYLAFWFQIRFWIRNLNPNLANSKGLDISKITYRYRYLFK